MSWISQIQSGHRHQRLIQSLLEEVMKSHHPSSLGFGAGGDKSAPNSFPFVDSKKQLSIYTSRPVLFLKGHNLQVCQMILGQKAED
uniref:Uncharacterized protein n=1 Tax=Trichinella nativa TaxID=6335 RepID=A0A0V1KJP8_9BILA